ncbi:MAG: DUF4129 domain-containing protein [Halobacteriales archaeon]
MSETDATGETGGSAAGPGATGVDRMQVALVALCLLALVVAAFVAPLPPTAGVLGGDGPGSGTGDSSGGSGGQSTATGGDSREADGDAGDGGSAGEGSGGESGESDGSGGGESQDGSGEGSDGEGSGDVITDDGAPIPVPGDEAPPTERGCAVVVLDEPVPGTSVAVRVYDDLEPAAGVQVWYNDRYVGRTDPTGRVAGRVPYTRTLNVTVHVPGSDCEFFRRPYDAESVGETEGAALGDGVTLAGGETGGLAASGAALAGNSRQSVGALDRRASQQTTQTDRNDTAAYDVRGSVNISVVGQPYPGETVTVLASVKGVPMRQAAVRVDGERVGETTHNGTYDLTVPDDREQVGVAVERGDFSGEATVSVWLLEVGFSPQEGLPFPGERALVTASAGPRPSGNATVSLDGRRLGRTDENGTVGFALPADPRGTVAVETERQRATRPLWGVYASTILLSLLLAAAGVVGVAATARVRGRGAAKRVATWWLAVATLFAGLVVGETSGLLLALGAVLLGAAVVHRRAVRSGGLTLAELLASAAATARRTALAVADWLAAALDRLWALLGRLAARVRGLPLSIRGLAGRLWDWLRALPGRIRRSLTSRLSGRRVLAAVGAVALLAGLTYRFGGPGLLGGLLALFAAFLASRWWTRAPDDGESTDAVAGVDSAGAAASTGGDDSRKRRTLRAIWRRFARRVRPGDWRQSTPGEVARAAIDRGYPERPVRVLTDAFRDVEYGDRSPTDRDEEAREAFESIERERGGDDA